MLTLTNTFARTPIPGESFDVNNDLWLSHCGTYVLHRDSHVTRADDTSLHGLACRALREYNARHVSRRTQAPTELESLVASIASRRNVSLPPVKESRK